MGFSRQEYWSGLPFPSSEASLVAQMVKSLPAMQETWIRSLSREDSPGEGNGNPFQSSAWRISWTEESGELQSVGSQSWTQLRDFSFTFRLIWGYVH